MELQTLRPFVPSGDDFPQAKQFFLDLGFQLQWENDGYAGLKLGAAEFILQSLSNSELQRNLMLQVAVDDLDAWWGHLQASAKPTSSETRRYRRKAHTVPDAPRYCISPIHPA